MSCAERRDDWLAYALDALDADERAALESHLAGGCPACLGYLAEARAVIAHLPLALPPTPPPAGVRRRLLVRLEAAHRHRAPPMPAAAAGWGRPLVVGALAAAATWIVVVLPLRARQAEIAGELVAQRGAVERMQAQLGAAMQAVRLLESRRLEMTILAAGSSQPDTWGRLLRDDDRRVWQLYAFGLEPLPPDRTYELWFITADDRKIPAGIFGAGADGRASHSVRVPAQLDGIVAAAVTDEPAGGAPQPTGSIRLLATL